MLKKVVVSLFGLMALGSGSAIAQGDAAAGKGKAAVCGACHGATGVSANNLGPHLAGQGNSYLVTQMKAFRDGSRKDPVMEPMAKPLSDQDIADLSAFFSTQTPATKAAAGPAKGDAAAGERLGTLCVNCHGANGMSPNDVWPNLAGQEHAYIVKQLSAYRVGARKEKQMQKIAKGLSDKDIDNVALFYSKMTPSASLSNGDRPIAELPPPTLVAGVAPIIASPEMFIPRPQPTRQYWADYLPEAPGRQIVVRKCQGCHDSQRTIAFSRSKDQWQHITESMIRRGTPLTAEEIPVLVDYLTQYFGPDSAPIPGHDGTQEVGMKPCKPEDWPKGSSDFRKNWQGSYNIWLSNQQGNSVDIVDPVTKKMVSRIKCINAADRAEFSGDGNTAYVPSRVEHNITVVDTRTGAIKAKVPVKDRPNTPVISRDFKKLYVAINPLRADEDKLGYIHVMDTATLKITNTIETKGGLHYNRLSPNGEMMLALGNQNYFLDLYDTKTDRLNFTCCTEVEVGDMQIEAAPDGSTSRLLLGLSGFPGVVAVDAKTGKELTRVEHPVCGLEGPAKGTRHQPATRFAYGFHGSEISPDGKSLWVMLGSFIYQYELPSLKSIGHLHLAQVDSAGKPYTPATEGARLTVSPDGKKVYASRPGRSLLSVIDVKTMKEEALVPTGRYPLHMSIWPRGSAPNNDHYESKATVDAQRDGARTAEARKR